MLQPNIRHAALNPVGEAHHSHPVRVQAIDDDCLGRALVAELFLVFSKVGNLEQGTAFCVELDFDGTVAAGVNPHLQVVVTGGARDTLQNPRTGAGRASLKP